MLAKMTPANPKPMKGQFSLGSLAAVAAFMTCLGFVHAKPVPSISDFSADLSKPLRLEFACPDEVKLQMAKSFDASKLSERARLLMLKKLEEDAKKPLKCFVEFTRDQINVNDMQIIPRSSVQKFWEMYHYNSIRNSFERFYYFMYAESDGASPKILKIKTWKVGDFNINYLRAWMTLQ